MERKCFAVFGIIEGLPEGEGKILLIHDKGKPSPAMWKLPGGRSNIEIEECPEYALIMVIFTSSSISLMSAYSGHSSISILLLPPGSFHIAGDGLPLS